MLQATGAQGLTMPPVQPTPRPPHQDAAGMARWLVHNALYATVSTQSTMYPGYPFGNTASISDGPLGASTGRLLFYAATISQIAADAASEPRASVSFSEASLQGSCGDEDPEWPMCARVRPVSCQIAILRTVLENQLSRNALLRRLPYICTAEAVWSGQ